MGQVENPSLFEGEAQLVIFRKSILVSRTTPAARQLAAEAIALQDQLPG